MLLFFKKEAFLALLLIAAAPLDRLQRADGALVVPDRFLRAWDPLTVFFNDDTGPQAGGPEDAPERLLTLTPPHPGAWTWLDRRTLQFRPAVPWTPLLRETITQNGRSATLIPLLPLPIAAAPADDPGGITDLDRFALTFDTPIEQAALARLLTIELRPLPGIDATGAQLLTAEDFDISAADRAKPGDPQTYLVVLHTSVPDGRMAILRLRLSDAPGLDDPIYELRLRSAAPFTLTDMVCADGFYHRIQDGLLRCLPDPDETPGPRGLDLSFSAEPEAMDIVRARQVLRISPPVDDLAVRPQGRDLHLLGHFAADTAYTLEFDPGLKDMRGRPLQGETAPRRFAFAPSKPALQWDASQGVVERFGPQMVPLRGHGYARADLRVYPIDPLSGDFWPFPDGVTTQDDTPPPLPGREPRHWTDAQAISKLGIQGRIASLGSPASSDLVDLPIRPGGEDAKFGIDIAPALSRIAGAGQPGTYLLGLRPVDGVNRAWLRVQVTDLSVSAVEDAASVHVAVTSLATARPVEGAEVRLEGISETGGFVTLARGVTAADGAWTYSPPARAQDTNTAKPALRRVVVTKGADVLLLEPGTHTPPRYADGTWTPHPGGNWLGWAAAGAVAARREQPRTLCHVFTERPIYRPEEPVLIGGMVRRYLAGGLSYAAGSGTALITGPDNQEFRVPATLDEVGGFHVRFDQKTEATGDYTLIFQPDGTSESCGQISFKKEAYRLPSFEVLLNAPPHASLDAPFDVGAIARWFAGGLLSDAPITWRVTQMPYVWTPPGREGFRFSSDSRFSNDSAFRSTPVLNRTGTTDAGGAAQLTLDPTIEPTAQPREYVIEATVTGNDDIQVRSVQHVAALPPFVLGVKQDRYLDHAGSIDPDILAADADGHPLAGLPMTVRLIHRNWNAVLQASDFAQGSAKYQTEVIDETVEERHLTSITEVQHLHFDAHDAGVYLVELEAADRIGRTQRVRVDLFMAGDTPVTWSRPPAQSVAVNADKDAYAPGETATLTIESPFQTARALAVVEEPGGFRYEWVDVANGFGRYAVPIRKTQMPRLAVHFLLMRGRLPGPPPGPTTPFDLGKPTTLAATGWLKVTPVENQVTVSFEAPPTARPAQEIDVVLHLADVKGAPLAGEATFWMVDQAVLSLAKERPLDPLPQFIVDRPARMVAHDSRNMAFGVIPLLETPGGDENGDFGMANISVRRNFTPVPIYVPRVRFGADGIARVHVRLPDTLTVYMLRAKAISGPDRFGFGAGQMRIRQPVVAQPALPRFLRPGDSFDAGLIARVVEGPGGAAHAALSVEGLQNNGAKEQAFAWNDTRPARLDFPLSVRPGGDLARLRFLVQRDADHAGDALEIALPIKPDRAPVHDRLVDTIAPGGALDVPADVAARSGTYARTVTLAADPRVVKLVGGLNALLLYPFGCTEQRIALSAAELALAPYAPILNAAGLHDRLAADVAGTALVIKQNTDDDGLVAFWPHTKGSVSLTAWAYGFLMAAKAADQPVDTAMLGRMKQVLQQALRSDYAHFITGEALRERVAALTALAQGGDVEPAYVGELSRLANAMPTETLAQAALAVAGLEKGDPQLLAGMMDTLWGRVRVLARNGSAVYAGLSDSGGSPDVLPSETRSLATLLHTVAKVTPAEPRLPLVREGLINLGDGEGWGSTNATTSALQALAANWSPPGGGAATITLPDRIVPARLDTAAPVLAAGTQQPGPVRVHNDGTAPLAALIDSDYTPAEPGALAQPIQHGFVLTRTLYRVPASGPLERLSPAADGAVHLAVGEVVEEADELVNPEDRTHVAITLPLAAGMEPLNPNIATAPAEAAPSAAPTLAPDFSSFGDDRTLFVYMALPRGTYTVRTRTRAQVAGSFTQPPAQVETMYRVGVTGASAGQRVNIRK